MATEIVGPSRWGGSRDAEGHRTYTICFKVRSARTDGPAAVMETSGLAQPGQWWTFDADSDLWAWCLPTMTAKPLPEFKDEPVTYWEVEQTFSTKPPDHNQQRCNDQKVEDPLLEPPKISGGFQKYQEEAVYDRFGYAITNSAFEQFRGKEVEFDHNRPTVKIEMNVADLLLAMLATFIDRVNGYPLWGLAPRCVKLSSVSWDRKYYGQCYVYYTRTLEFDIREETFDRNLLDEGTKALWGENRGGTWHITPVNAAGMLPQRWNPLHYVRYKDAHGENARVILNGFGLPAGHVSAALPPGSATPTPYYIAIVGSTNQRPPNPTYWVAQVGGDDVWDSTVAYVTGNVVTVDWGSSGSQTYITLNGNTNQKPPQSSTNQYWYFLPNGINSRGTWNASTAYNNGDQVILGGPPGTGTIGGDTGAGSLHVEVYREVDFLLLGIPTSF